MKLITLHQPWAGLVALGLKKYETRHWSTDYRGEVLIHAAKRQMVRAELDQMMKEAEWPHLMDSLLGEAIAKIQAAPHYGCIVAIARLSNCQLMTDAECCSDESLINISEVSYLERAVGLWDIDRYALQLDDVRPIHQPIPFTSRQGKLLEAPPEIAQAAIHQTTPIAF